MKKYQLAINGCDDSTYMELELTDDEYRLVKSICDRSEKESSYVCQPTMEIKEL